MQSEDWISKYQKLLFSPQLNWNELHTLVQEHMPSHFFRYGSFESIHWKDVIFSGQVRLSSPEYFNDPFDCEMSLNESIISAKLIKDRTLKLLRQTFKKLGIKLNSVDKSRLELSTNLLKDIELVLSRYVSGTERLAEIFRKTITHLDEEARRILGVVCFSTDNLSILMWSHYSKYHTGYCLDYTIPSKDMNILPVLYKKERPNYVKRALEGNENWATTAALCKSDVWSYENEWRLLLVNPRKSDIFIDFSSCLNGIFLGAKTNPEHQNEILEFGSRKNIPVYQMRMSDNEYKLTPAKLN